MGQQVASQQKGKKGETIMIQIILTILRYNWATALVLITIGNILNEVI